MLKKIQLSCDKKLRKKVFCMELVLNNIKKSFNNKIVLKDINLEIKAGEFVCILGHSGCGKSTMLNLIAGFTKPDSGVISVDQVPIGKPSQDRGIVFQEHALFPWYTVIENIAFGPNVQGMAKKEAQNLAYKYLKMIGLEQYAHHYPAELSGGMKQRVGIARALAGQPKLLLMDEPFAALDVFTKEIMRKELIDIWQELQTTIVFITHDISEAVYLADRIVVMKNGIIACEKQVGIARPRNIEETKNRELIHELQYILKD